MGESAKLKDEAIAELKRRIAEHKRDNAEQKRKLDHVRGVLGDLLNECLKSVSGLVSVDRNGNVLMMGSIKSTSGSSRSRFSDVSLDEEMLNRAQSAMGDMEQEDIPAQFKTPLYSPSPRTASPPVATGSGLRPPGTISSQTPPPSPPLSVAATPKSSTRKLKTLKSSSAGSRSSGPVVAWKIGATRKAPRSSPIVYGPVGYRELLQQLDDGATTEIVRCNFTDYLWSILLMY